MEQERKVSLEQLQKMDEEQLKKIEEKLGSTLRNMVDETVEKANKILSIYGMRAKMIISIEEAD